MDLSEESGLHVAYGSSPNKSSSYDSSFGGLTSSYYSGKKMKMLYEKNQSVMSLLNKFGIVQAIQVFILVCLLFSHHYKNEKLHAASTELNDIHVELAESLNLLDEFEHDLDIAQQELLRMHKTMITKEDQHDHENDEYWLHHEETIDISNDVIAKHNAQEERIIQLQKSIQRMHKFELERRFGDGPYFIEFEVSIKGSKRFFTVETASNDLMPHSVYYFMDLVDRKMWDGALFVHNWDHIVQAAPISDLRESMGQLAFPEYSNMYDHGPYTIGFAGRPGGPEFYINLIDNSDYHGPGGQPHSTILNDADPSFAKVVLGKDIVDEMKVINSQEIARIRDGDRQKGGYLTTTINAARIVKFTEDQKKHLFSH